MERDGKIFVNEDGKDASGLFFEMPHCYYGDYFGDVMTMSNFLTITSEKFLESNDLPPFVVGISGYDGHSLYYDLARATEEQLGNLKELLEDLDGYPVIDEDAWSNLEQETIDKDIFDNMTGWVEHELSKMDRDDIVDARSEGKICIGEMIWAIINENDIETYVEGCYDVVYAKWGEEEFAEGIVRMFDSRKED